MCIVIYKPKGVECPDYETLWNCWETNSDGAGFIRIDKESKVKKGYMTFKDFHDAYEDEGFTKDDEFALHFRIGTSGGNIPANCHPFPITDNEKRLRILEYKTRYAVLHNGILGPGRNKLSDTMVFIIEVLDLVKDALHVPRIQDAISEMITGSKLLLIQNGQVIKLGSGWIEDKGMWYTNSSYKDGYMRYYGSTSSWRKGGGRNYAWDEEDYLYYPESEYTRSQNRTFFNESVDDTEVDREGFIIEGADLICTECGYSPIKPEDRIDPTDPDCEEYYCPDCAQITTGKYFWF